MTAMCSLVWLIGEKVTVKVTAAGLSLSGWQLSEVLTVIILCSDVFGGKYCYQDARQGLLSGTRRDSMRKP